MTSDDALTLLLANFQLQRSGLDADENEEFDLEGAFQFSVAVVDDHTLRLSLALPGDADSLKDATLRRLLEGNMLGAETGAGQIAIHPGLGLALVETIDLAGLSEDALKLRLVNFMLYGEYWLSEGLADVLAETDRSAPTASDAEVFIRP